MKYQHCVIDLETLGIRPGSVILSIGAVMLDMDTGKLGPTFYCVVSAHSQDRMMGVDPTTLQWWAKQESAALVVYRESMELPIINERRVENALTAFARWLDEHAAPGVQVWGNGSDFDNALLAEAYSRYEISIPWKFYHNRCLRTLREMASMLGFAPKRPTPVIAHHALHDAIAQADWVYLLWSLIRDSNATKNMIATSGQKASDSVTLSSTSVADAAGLMDSSSSPEENHF